MDFKRITRWVLVVWCIAAVLVLALIILPRHQYRRTGDKLYDRTMLWILDHSVLTKEPTIVDRWLERTSYHVARPRSLDRDTVLGWQDEFEADPRYWELAAQLENIDWQLWAIASQRGYFYDLPARSGSDADLLAGLEFCEFTEGTHFLLSSRGGAQSELEDSRKDIEASIRRQLELLNAAITLEPNNSYFYYEKADFMLSLGESEMAWKYVRKGNEAALNYKPLPFPVKELHGNRRNIHSRDAKLAAVLFIAQAGKDKLLTHKERYKEINCLLALGAPLELGDDYLLMAGRRARMDNQDLVGQISANVTVEILLNYLEAECLDLSLDQQRELSQVRAEITAARADVELVINQIWPHNDCPFMPSYQAPISFAADDWDGYIKVIDAVDAAKHKYEILETRPLSAWGRGELAGIE